MKLIKAKNREIEGMVHSEPGGRTLEAWRYKDSVHLLIDGHQINLSRKDADKLLKYLLNKKPKKKSGI